VLRVEQKVAVRSLLKQVRVQTLACNCICMCVYTAARPVCGPDCAGRFIRAMKQTSAGQVLQRTGRERIGMCPWTGTDLKDWVPVCCRDQGTLTMQ
jgi:hypothetical protein